jgi:hypothetical protein
MWKNIVEPHRPQMTIRRVRFACWVTKATNTHSEYVILNYFPLQQWLHERASVLRYTYIACFVPFIVAIRARILTLLLSALTLTLRGINAMAFLLAYTMFMPDARVRANNF